MIIIIIKSNNNNDNNNDSIDSNNNNNQSLFQIQMFWCSSAFLHDCHLRDLWIQSDLLESTVFLCVKWNLQSHMLCLLDFHQDLHSIATAHATLIWALCVECNIDSEINLLCVHLSFFRISSITSIDTLLIPSHFKSLQAKP